VKGDVKHMLMGEVTECLKNGANSQAIADLVGCSKDTVARRLRENFNITYNNKTKQWDFNNGDPDPMIDFSEIALKRRVSHSSSHEPESSSHTISHSSSHEQNEIVHDRSIDNIFRDSHSDSPSDSHTNTQEIHTVFTQQFTSEEVATLKKMATLFKRSAITREASDLDYRITQLPKIAMKNKVRKTIVIDPVIASLFDEFAEDRGLNKSDVIHLALQDFIQKYSK
jgi:hypothetical protein